MLKCKSTTFEDLTKEFTLDEISKANIICHTYENGDMMILKNRFGKIGFESFK